MTQKELLYLEDIYNHEILLTKIITETDKKECDDDCKEMFNMHLKIHEDLLKKIEKLLRSESNE